MVVARTIWGDTYMTLVRAVMINMQASESSSMCRSPSSRSSPLNTPHFLHRCCLPCPLLSHATPHLCNLMHSLCMQQLDGDISDQLKGRFAPGFSVPQICSALEKAAVDPRINGIAVEIGPLGVSHAWRSCGLPMHAWCLRGIALSHACNVNLLACIAWITDLSSS